MFRIRQSALVLPLALVFTQSATAQPVKSIEPVPYPGGPDTECAIAAAVIATLPPMIAFDPVLRGTSDSDKTDCSAAFTAAHVKLLAYDPGDRTSVFTLLSRPLRTADGQASIDVAAIGPGYRKSQTYVLAQKAGQWTVVSSRVNAES